MATTRFIFYSLPANLSGKPFEIAKGKHTLLYWICIGYSVVTTWPHDMASGGGSIEGARALSHHICTGHVIPVQTVTDPQSITVPNQHFWSPAATGHGKSVSCLLCLSVSDSSGFCMCPFLNLSPCPSKGHVVDHMLNGHNGRDSRRQVMFLLWESQS